MPDGRRAARLGRDNRVPPHALLGGAAAVACARKERRVGVLPGVVNTRTQREGGGATGRAIAGTGGGGGAFLVVALACSLAWYIQTPSR